MAHTGVPGRNSLESQSCLPHPGIDRDSAWRQRYQTVTVGRATVAFRAAAIKNEATSKLIFTAESSGLLMPAVGRATQDRLPASQPSKGLVGQATGEGQARRPSILDLVLEWCGWRS